QPRVRLAAAEALETFADPDAFLQLVVHWFNDRGEEQPWHIPADVVAAVAELVTFGAPQTRARTAALLGTLAEKEQAAWDQAWAAHAERFAAELAALRRQAGQRRPVPLQ